MSIMNWKLRYQGYNCYPGTGWRRYGRLIVNFTNNEITSIFFDGVQLYGEVWHE